MQATSCLHLVLVLHRLQCALVHQSSDAKERIYSGNSARVLFVAPILSV
jgi:hypothetical protein